MTIWKTNPAVWLALAFALTCVPAARAQDNAENASPKAAITVDAWKGRLSTTDQLTPDGQAAHAIALIAQASAGEPIEIDPNQAYEVAGYFKSLDAKQPSRVLFDITFLDKDQKVIPPTAIFPVTSISTLNKPAAIGDQTLHVQPQSDWPDTHKLHNIALHAKEDHSDLPNLSVLSLKGIEKASDHFVLELGKPLAEALPAGTPLRLHRYADYPRVWNNQLPDQWTRMAFTLTPDFKIGQWPRNVIWPGAKYLRIVIRNQYQHYPKPLPKGEEPPTLLFGQITITPTQTTPQANP